MEAGINRSLCWPVQGVDTLKSVYFFHAHLETILISDAINIYLNEDRDEEKLKVWTESRPEYFFFFEISSQTSPDFSEIRNSWIHIKCVR